MCFTHTLGCATRNELASSPASLATNWRTNRRARALRPARPASSSVSRSSWALTTLRLLTSKHQLVTTAETSWPVRVVAQPLCSCGLLAVFFSLSSCGGRLRASGRSLDGWGRGGSGGGRARTSHVAIAYAIAMSKHKEQLQKRPCPRRPIKRFASAPRGRSPLAQVRRNAGQLTSGLRVASYRPERPNTLTAEVGKDRPAAGHAALRRRDARTD